GRYSHHLFRRDIDVLNLIGTDVTKIPAEARDNPILCQFVTVRRGIGRGQVRERLFVGAQPGDLVAELALGDLPVWRDQEAVFVDSGVNAQAGDQANVRTFGCFDGANTAVVRDVNVAHFEAGPFAVQAARSESTQTPLMRQ